MAGSSASRAAERETKRQARVRGVELSLRLGTCILRTDKVVGSHFTTSILALESQRGIL
jgi:hypothetical protein